MINRSYLNPDDDDLQDLTNDRSPYTSVSTNEPLIDPNAITPPDEEESDVDRDPASMPPMNPVMQMISSRNNLDPNLRQFDEREAQLERNLASQNQANFYANIGHAAQRAAQGSNTPGMDESFYTNLQNQNKDILKTRETSQTRRQLIMEAIQKRNQRALEKSEAKAFQDKKFAADQKNKDEDQAIQREANAIRRIQAAQGVGTRNDAREQARIDKQEVAGRLSEKQLGEVQDFDRSIKSMESIISQLGNKDNWVGSVDGNWPKAISNAEHVAWRAQVGRLADQYRHLITGAGAGNQELAKLEGRLPTPTDYYDNFIAKAKNYIDTVKQERESFLNNMRLNGRNTAPFEGQSSHSSQKPVTRINPKNGKTLRMVDGRWWEDD